MPLPRSGSSLHDHKALSTCSVLDCVLIAWDVESILFPLDIRRAPSLASHMSSAWSPHYFFTELHVVSHPWVLSMWSHTLVKYVHIMFVILYGEFIWRMWNIPIRSIIDCARRIVYEIRRMYPIPIQPYLFNVIYFLALALDYTWRSTSARVLCLHAVH
jgi:hypothetical protein